MKLRLLQPSVACLGCLLLLIGAGPSDSEAIHVNFNGGVSKVIRLRTGISFFISPDRTLKSIPPEMKALRYTQRELSADIGTVSINAPAESSAYVIFCGDRDQSNLMTTLSKTGWTRLSQVIKVSSPNFDSFNVFKRSFDTPTQLTLDGHGLKCSIMVAAEKLKVDGGDRADEK